MKRNIILLYLPLDDVVKKLINSETYGIYISSINGLVTVLSQVMGLCCFLKVGHLWKRRERAKLGLTGSFITKTCATS